MTATQYAKHRRSYGSQQAVADALKVHQVTIARRETGALPITKEAALALLWLVAANGKAVRAEQRKRNTTQNPLRVQRVSVSRKGKVSPV